VRNFTRIRLNDRPPTDKEKVHKSDREGTKKPSGQHPCDVSAFPAMCGDPNSYGQVNMKPEHIDNDETEDAVLNFVSYMVCAHKADNGYACSSNSCPLRQRPLIFRRHIRLPHTIVWMQSRGYPHHSRDGKGYLFGAWRTDTHSTGRPWLAADRPCRRNRDARKLRVRFGTWAERNLSADAASGSSGFRYDSFRFAQGHRVGNPAISRDLLPLLVTEQFKLGHYPPMSLMDSP